MSEGVRKGLHRRLGKELFDRARELLGPVYVGAEIDSITAAAA